MQMSHNTTEKQTSQDFRRRFLGEEDVKDDCPQCEGSRAIQDQQ